MTPRGACNGEPLPYPGRVGKGMGLVGCTETLTQVELRSDFICILEGEKVDRVSKGLVYDKKVRKTHPSSPLQ